MLFHLRKWLSEVTEVSSCRRTRERFRHGWCWRFTESSMTSTMPRAFHAKPHVAGFRCLRLIGDATVWGPFVDPRSLIRVQRPASNDARGVFTNGDIIGTLCLSNRRYPLIYRSFSRRSARPSKPRWSAERRDVPIARFVRSRFPEMDVDCRRLIMH